MPSNDDFLTHLDRKLHSDDVEASYDPQTNLTTFTLPYRTARPMWAVVGETTVLSTRTYTRGQRIPIVYQDNYTIEVQGNVSDVPLWFGEGYSQVVTPSTQYLRKQSQGGGVVAETSGRLQYRRWNVIYKDSGYFRSEVIPRYRLTYTKVMNCYTVGETELGEPQMVSGVHSFLVPAKNDEVTISFINDSPFPSTFVSASFDAEFSKKGRTV